MKERKRGERDTMKEREGLRESVRGGGEKIWRREKREIK